MASRFAIASFHLTTIRTLLSEKCHHVNGSLSTLSIPVRKRLIEVYVDQQLSPLNLRPKEKQLYVNRKTRKALVEVLPSSQYCSSPCFLLRGKTGISFHI